MVQPPQIIMERLWFLLFANFICKYWRERRLFLLLSLEFAFGNIVTKMGSRYQGYSDELKYISVPVNANWHFGSTRKWNLNFGPTFGVLTSATSNGVDVKSEANGFQYGLQVGIGYKLQLTDKFSILLDYQSMSGLSKVSKNSQNELKNSYGSFDLGAVFKL